METKNYYAEIIKNEVEAIKKCAMSNGAVGMYAPEYNYSAIKSLPTVEGIKPTEYGYWKYVKVNPYFSDSAIYGLIQSDIATSSKDGKDTAKAYIEWYVSVMNTAESDICGVAGTVYDYYVFESKDGRCINVSVKDATATEYQGKQNPNDYDSTDSYAAMMLDIINLYIAAYGNDLDIDFNNVIDLLLGVIKSDFVASLGLTVAKPNYRICYLMDNCEVYSGLISAKEIYSDYIGDSAKANECAELADKIKDGIMSHLWREKDGCYIAGVSDNGKDAYKLDLSEFYPQGSCQVFPIIFGLYGKDDGKAVDTYAKFKSSFGTEWLAGKTDSYPWCMLVRACLVMDDTDFAAEFIKNINNKYSRWKHTSPYYCAEAGNTLYAASVLYTIAQQDTAESSVPEQSETVSQVGEASAEPSEASDMSAETSTPDNESGGINQIIPIAAAVAAAAVITAIILIKKKKKK